MLRNSAEQAVSYKDHNCHKKKTSTGFIEFLIYFGAQECFFNKLASNTALKVEFSGDYRICCCLDCCKRWYFTFNGVECVNPLAIDGVAHIQANHGRSDHNIHKTTQIGRYCEGIAKGSVRVGINGKSV